MPDAFSQCWNEIGVRGTGACERLPEVAHCRNCPEYARAGRGLLDREIPEGLREEWARSLAEPKQITPPGVISVVVFRIRNECLALKTALFQEVVEPRAIHGVPLRSNRIFKGLVNVNGELLLCFSAADGLGLEAESGPAGPEAGRMLVVNIAGERLAFPVDEVLGIRALAPDDIETAPATLAKQPGAATAGIFSAGGRRAGLLDGEKFAQLMFRSLGQ